jgi:hypothetical protein
MRKPHFVLQLVLIFVFAPAFVVIASADDSNESETRSLPADPLPARQPNSAKEPGTPIAIGIGVKASTLGLGGEVGVPITHNSNVRFGFNLFNYSHTFTKDGIAYKGSLNLRSAQATFDFFPIGPLHISPGVLLYNGNNLSANTSVPGGQAFTLNNTTYISDSADPVGGTGKLTVYKTAPMLLLGVGNLVPRSSRHFTSNFEIGAAYQGPPRIALNLTGSACDSTGLFCRPISSDPTIQSNILAEQSKLEKKASPFRFYPVISFGFGFKF